MIVSEVDRAKERSGWAVRKTLAALEVSPATFYRHKRRLERGEPPRRRRGFSIYQATPVERAAVVRFARTRPELRHRVLAWTMVDEDVACLSPSTVYRILREAGLVREWRPKERGSRKPRSRPSAPNRQWQTDLRYVTVEHRTYYLLVFLDVFSRYVVYHELLRSMDGETVALATQSALETMPEQLRRRIRVQSDNGSAYVSHDFARVLQEHGTAHHRIWPNTPEQNGHVERVMRTLGESLHEDEFEAFDETERANDEIVDWYNHERLHSALGYLTPADVHFGRAEEIRDERQRKLAAARHARKEKNLKLRQLSLATRSSSVDAESQTTENPELSQFA